MLKYYYLKGNLQKEGDVLILEYSDKKVEKIICDDKILQKKIGTEFGKKVKMRLNQLKATDNFYEYLSKIGLGKPHLLEGNLGGCYGVSINANYRLVVQPLVKNLDIENLKNCKVLDIKGVLDYHGGKNEWIIP